MELIQLMYFKMIAEQQNMSQAARMLHVSQPTLSASLGKLEAELGVELFDRSKGRLTLNHMGRMLLKRVNRIMDEISKAESELGGVARKSALPVQVLTSVPHLCSEIAVAFQEANPNVSLQFDTIDQAWIKEKVMTSRVDFIISEKLDAASFDWLPVTSEVYDYYIGSRHSLWESRDNITIEQLDELPRVFWRSGVDSQPAIRDLPNIVGATNDAYYALSLVSSGAVYARLPRALAERCLSANAGIDACRIQVGRNPMVVSIGLSRPKGTELSAHARLAYDYFADHLVNREI